MDDIQVVLARVQKHAFPLYRPLRDTVYETGGITACQREFLLQDPDGYLLRFSQYLE